MKIKYMHVADSMFFGRYHISEAEEAFSHLFTTSGATLSVVYNNGAYFDLKVVGYSPPEGQEDSGDE